MQALFPEIKLVRDLIIVPYLYKIHSLCRTLNGHVNDSANESDFELLNLDPVTDHQKRNSSESQLQQINNLLSDLGQQLQDPQVRNLPCRS
jgi:hypothetical protein